MNKFTAAYRAILLKLKFREFMHIIVTLFGVMFVIGVIQDSAIMFNGSLPMYFRIIYILSVIIIAPVLLYFLLRVTQWFFSKVGFENLYNTVFKRWGVSEIP